MSGYNAPKIVEALGAIQLGAYDLAILIDWLSSIAPATSMLACCTVANPSLKVKTSWPL
jgi:hypothetical protein